MGMSQTTQAQDNTGAAHGQTLRCTIFNVKALWNVNKEFYHHVPSATPL